MCRRFGSEVTVVETEKTRRNGGISDERKVVSASIRPTAPMLNSVGSAARPRMSPAPFCDAGNQGERRCNSDPDTQWLHDGQLASLERAPRGIGFQRITAAGKSPMRWFGLASGPGFVAY
jgi:hypothetical protein